MRAVIFEVWPASGRKDDYLKMAAALKSEVEQIDGFISVERFESLYEQGKLLSLQFWRDDEAIGKWRRHLEHSGLGHVSEIADADAPHVARGCPFQAWSVGELLRLERLLSSQ